jgi:hypothetical protein
LQTNQIEMAKKKIKAEESQLLEFEVANCDLKKSNNILSQSEIESLILTIRGQQVLIDRDLAVLYGVETRRLNEQVKRNKERFPDDFCFQLNELEFENWRSQFATSNSDKMGLRRAPNAFTEQGVAMLASVLKSETAIVASVRIMRAFVAMRRFIVQNTNLLMKIAHMEKHQIETDEKIDAILDRMDQNSQKMLPEAVFPTGCVWDAWTYVSDLVRSAKRRIVLIDNFVDDRVLTMLTKRAEGVTATIHTRYSEQFLTDLKKHNEQYPTIEFIQLPHRHHDRFLIIDDKVHFLGASVKDMGAGLCAVTMMEIAPETILELVK